MATTQSTFGLTVSPSSDMQVQGNSGVVRDVGGGNSTGGVSSNTQGLGPPPSSVSVVTSASQIQTIVAAAAAGVTITPVSHQPTLLHQNSLEVPLDSPGDAGGASSNGIQNSSQVTAQVVVTSGTGEGTIVTTASVDENGSPVQSIGTSHFLTVTESNGSRSYTSLTPVNPVVVSESDAVGSEAVSQGVHPTYVQYVEGSPDTAAIYAATNGQMAYPVYTVAETSTMYTPATGQYYAGNTTVTYSQVASGLNQGAGTGQLLTQGNGTYLIQQGVDPETAHSLIASQRTSPQTVTADNGGVAYMVSGNTNPSSLDGDGHPSLCHANRVSPATVQWLLENYETAEGVSLPRSTLYNHYLRHCSENKLDPVNAASFGKLIRSVFLGLRTRRLGTRGNSKYHYYGIRVKPGSNLNQLSEDGTSRQQHGSSQKRFKFQKVEQYDHGGTGGNNSSLNNSNSLSSQVQHQEFLGDGTNAIPEFPQITFSSPLPEDCTLEDVDTLRSIYREHCEAFLDAVMNLEFHTVESLWREFWRSQDNNNGDECEEEKYLSKTKLFSLCKCRPIQYFIRHVDFHFYQKLVEVLIPDVLRPIPSSLTQSIRNFAKGLESWLTQAMNGCPDELVRIKVTAVSAFAQTLRRYTSLNHLAQAARAVLQNSNQISQMLVDLNRVDFHNVQDQASWVCQCDDNVVQRLESDFKMTLQQQNSLEEWAAWLKTVVTDVLKPYEGKPNFANAARQFLLKWSFYSSMVIRDLTLRSAASFGSFHLIRLLYDEYMFYLIEHLVATETGETPIAVIGDKSKNPSTCDGYSQAGGPCNGGLSLNIVGEKYLSGSLLMNSNEMNHHPEIKRVKIS